MKAKQRIVHLAALLLLSPALHAQEQKQLSLQEAIDLSIRNSKQLKLSDAKVLEATASLREARERRLPDASIQGSYLRLNKPNIDMKTGNQENSGEGGSSSSTPEVNQVVYGIANVSVPLFSGFRINYGIESAKYLEQAAKLDAGKDREEVIQNTISAYSNLYKARAAVDLVKENLRQSEQRVSDFSGLEKNGLMARNDLLKAQLQQSNVELSLLDAESNLRIAIINMDLMLGLPQGTELITDTVFHAGDESRNAGDWEMIAFSNRKDAAALALREKASYSAIKAAKGEYYPSVALTGGYVAADVQNFLTVTNALNAGVGLKYSPSSLWKNGAKVAEAKARHAQTIANQQILDDAIRVQVNQSYQNLLLSNKKIEVYAKAVEQANENYKIVKNKYDNSLANTTDLLDADVAQLQARLNYAFAKADALVAYNRLLQTAGVLDKNSAASNQ